jgi:hypothetical protein
MQSSKKTTASIGFVLAIGALSTTSGCATVTGLVSGAFTGAVDAPAQVYRLHREAFAEEPIYWPINICVCVPLGILFGPLMGFAKGMALDCECLIGQQTYGPVFGTYAEPSIWRPYTIHW